MKRTYSYKDCYRILNVNPDCSWSELRKTYKKTIQKWHPDRFQTDSKEKITADGKIKIINIAYSKINKYYRENGTLPPVERPPAVKQQLPVKPAYSPKKTEETTKTTTNRSTSYKKAESKQPGHPLVKGGLILLITGSYYFFADDFYSETPTDNKRTSKTHDGSMPIASNIQNKAPASKKHLEDKLVEKNENSTYENHPGDIELTIDNAYFTSGSSITDVIDIMGAPSRTEGDIWFYGESEVHFNEGRVSHWVRNAQTPLKAKMTFDTPEALNTNKPGIN